MRPPYQISIWKTAPFLRLLIPFITGVISQWYLKLPVGFVGLCIVCFTLSFFLFYFLPLAKRYQFSWLQGILLNLIIISVALFATYGQDVRHDDKWFGHFYKPGAMLLVKINEPPIEKTNSYKADGIVQGIIENGKVTPTNGKLLLYLKKNDTSAMLRYGDKILLDQSLQKIKNSGNPGAFNYERYAAFQQLFYNVYLKSTDFILLPQKEINLFDQFIFSARQYIVTAVRKYLPDDKNVSGIAEALLIGYKEDLDKDLVQAYSNTGVVHIIAISGLHLGLIYVMLFFYFYTFTHY